MRSSSDHREFQRPVRTTPHAAGHAQNADHTLALRQGLLGGGLGIVEVGLRNPYAMTALADLAAGGDLIVGSGTVLDAGQAEAALDAGASFLVTPAYADDIIAVAQSRGVPVVPGVATATEVKRPGFGGGSQLTEDESHGSTEEVPGRVA